jgi:predicted amidophosphoribosyltransferase
MYKCLNENCGKTFEQPAKQYDEKGNYIEVCPYCEQDEKERVSICTKCGEPSEYLETLCDGCKGLIRDTLRSPVNFLLTDYGFDAKDIEEQFAQLVERGV